MFDFTINDCGDLVRDESASDIKKCQSSLLVRQLALVRIKSVTKDWFNHNTLGANLEMLLGDMITQNTFLEIEELILNSISDIIHKDNVFITSSLVGDRMETQVYIRVNTKQTVLIKVTIDVVGGVNVVYEIDPQ